MLVHTDRKAPIVGVTTYYRVGSKNEPRGRTGFAHLFEHLMFGGSENVENFDIPLEAAGSTSTNGSTWYDRTNYVETVPTGALDRALMMESDRMGHLLGAVTQDKLDKQRGVVQNEKRQGDNQPYGLAEYAIGDNLLPVGHPYRHSTIGSMADLDAASIADVRAWFRGHYGPNNVVLALTGDIDAATARPIVERWYGAIPRGPEVAPVAAPVVAPAAPVMREMADQVPVTRISRTWTGPGINHSDAIPLQVGLYVLGGLASSRLDNALVRGDELAVRVSASDQQHEELSFLSAEMDVKPGEDRAAAEARFGKVIADYIAQGPTQDELTRAATQVVSAQIGALERVGGFGGTGATLAEGLLYSNDPARYKAELAEIASLTPARVTAALHTWLTRPPLTLAVVPGTRTEDGATLGGWGDEGTVAPPRPDAKKPAAKVAKGPAIPIPPIADVGALPFPALERTTLSNGIPVLLARRTAIPKVSIDLRFDAGYAVDAKDREGIHSLMIDALEEGTRTRDATQIAEDQERLGASIDASSSLDSDDVTLTALTANLAPSLALMADIVKNPAYAEKDVARVRDQRLADISQALANPRGIAARALMPIVYGDAHPYGTVGAAGTAAAVQTVTPEALAIEHRHWLRPDTASFTVVGDVTMAELLPPARSHFRQVARRSLGAPGQGSVRRYPRAEDAAGCDRPAQFAAIGDLCRAGAAGDRRDQGSRIARSRQRGAGRWLPVAAQHDHPRGQGLELWRAQRRLRAGRAAAAHRRSACPGRPHRRFDRADPVDDERFRDGQERSRRHRVEPGDRRRHPRPAQSLRDQWPGARSSARHAGARAARRLLHQPRRDLPRARRIGHRRFGQAVSGRQQPRHRGGGRSQGHRPAAHEARPACRGDASALEPN